MLCVGRARRAGPRNLEGRIVNGNEGGLSDPFLNPGYGRSFGCRGGGGAGGLYPVELDPGLEMVIVVIPGPCCAMTTRRYGDVAVRSRKSVGWKADPVDYYLSSALFLFLRLLSFCYYRGLSHSPAIHRTTFYGSTFGFSLGNSGRIGFLSITHEPRWTMMAMMAMTTVREYRRTRLSRIRSGIDMSCGWRVCDTFMGFEIRNDLRNRADLAPDLSDGDLRT